MHGNNPDQYTERQSGLEPDTLENRLADYIDTAVLAQCVVEEMSEQGVEMSFENAKRIWLSVLENLHDLVVSASNCIND